MSSAYQAIAPVASSAAVIIDGACDCGWLQQAAAMSAGGWANKLLSQRGKPAAVRDTRVVAGEFRVVRKSALPLSH